MRLTLENGATGPAGANGTPGTDYSTATGSQNIKPQEFVSTVDAKGTETEEMPKHVQTTDATVTTLDSFTLASGTAVVWSCVVVAQKSDSSQAASYVRTATFRNNAGTVAIVGSVLDGGTSEDDSAWDCTIDNSGTSIRLRVTGKSSTTIQWSCVSSRLAVVP